MQRTSATLTAFLLALTLGCGPSNTVEMPKNPAPKPENPFLLEQSAATSQGGAPQKQTLPSRAEKKPTPGR